MTLTEVLVALVVVLILISATFRLGRYVTTRSQVQLTQSMLGVIETALEQYYSDVGAFPPVVTDGLFFEDKENGFVQAVDGQGMQVDLEMFEEDWSGHNDWPSTALYYYLDRRPNSRGMVAAVSYSLLTNKDQNGNDVVIELSANQQRDLVRFVDPWGTSLWYRHQTGWAFPQIISAGPDRVFGTDDDIKNNF